MKDILDKVLEYESTYRIVGRAHYIAADRYTAFNRWFGIPVIIITAVVGTTIFGTLDENPGSNMENCGRLGVSCRHCSVITADLIGIFANGRKA